MSYYTDQIKEVEAAYDFLEQYYDHRCGFTWRKEPRDLEEPNHVYFDFAGMKVSEVISFLKENCYPDEEIQCEYEDTDQYYIERYDQINQTDEEYLDYIANSFDFKSEYNLSASWIDTTLHYKDDILYEMATNLTQKRFDILKSFKNEELVEAETIVNFLLDKSAFRHRVANLYTYCDQKWGETDTEKKIKDIRIALKAKKK